MTSPRNKIAFETGTYQSFFFYAPPTPLSLIFKMHSNAPPTLQEQILARITPLKRLFHRTNPSHTPLTRLLKQLREPQQKREAAETVWEA